MSLIKKAVLIASVAATLCLVLYLVIAQRAHPGSVARPNALPGEIAAAKRAGLPINLIDLQKPLPPSSQDAALIYAQLDALIKSKPIGPVDEKAIEDVYHSTPTAAQIAAARGVLTRRTDILTLIHQAAARPHCAFVRVWAQDPAITMAEMLPHLARLREVAYWLNAESALLALDGKPLEAVRNQALGFRVASHTVDQPIITQLLVGIVVESITMRGMQGLLYQAGGRADVDAAIRQALEKVRQPFHLLPALETEMAFSLAELQNARRGSAQVLDSLIDENPSQAQALRKKYDYPSDPVQAMNRFIDANGANIVRSTLQVRTALAHSYPQAVKEVQSIIAAETSPNPDHAFESTMITIFSTVPTKLAHSQATAEVIRSAAALLAWKAQHGAFPTTLSQALAPVPTDPFDGKPLRYKREGGGFVVYSVGETGRFDGGAPNVAPARTEVLFRYPMPSYWK